MWKDSKFIVTVDNHLLVVDGVDMIHKKPEKTVRLDICSCVDNYEELSVEFIEKKVGVIFSSVNKCMFKLESHSEMEEFLKVVKGICK
mmetsp:Transcript_129716/g.193084  ORF Transcript_129716/g.193084 Transcript_129716/m.193084 type:complete len:88 (+) Transcript_129716:269-532(+)